MTKPSPTLQHWLILMLLGAIWGSSFILMKMGLRHYTGLQVGSLRIVFTFVLFLPYAIYSLRKIPKNKLLPVAAIGLLGSFFPAYLFATAQDNGIDSSISGILNSLTPLFTYLWGVFFFLQPKNNIRLLGIVLGLLGAIVIVYDGHTSIDKFALLIFIATMCYGLSGNIAKHFLQEVSPRYITAVSFFFVGLPALLILSTTDVVQVTMQGGGVLWSLAAIFVLSVVGTALALLLFWKLIQQTDPIFGSITTYLIPLVAIAWGVLDGEQLQVNHLFGFLLIMISVLLVKQIKKTNKETAIVKDSH